MKSRTLMMSRSLLKSLLRSSLLKSHSLMKWKITVMKSQIRDLDPLILLPYNSDEKCATVPQQAEVIVNISKFQFPR